MNKRKTYIHPDVCVKEIECEYMIANSPDKPEDKYYQIEIDFDPEDGWNSWVR